MKAERRSTASFPWGHLLAVHVGTGAGCRGGPAKPWEAHPLAQFQPQADLKRGRGGPAAVMCGVEGEPEKQLLSGSLGTFARCCTVGQKVGRCQEL